MSLAGRMAPWGPMSLMNHVSPTVSARPMSLLGPVSSRATRAIWAPREPDKPYEPYEPF